MLSDVDPFLLFVRHQYQTPSAPASFVSPFVRLLFLALWLGIQQRFCFALGQLQTALGPFDAFHPLCLLFNITSCMFDIQVSFQQFYATHRMPVARQILN